MDLGLGDIWVMFVFRGWVLGDYFSSQEPPAGLGYIKRVVKSLFSGVGFGISCVGLLFG